MILAFDRRCTHAPAAPERPLRRRLQEWHSVALGRPPGDRHYALPESDSIIVSIALNQRMTDNTVPLPESDLWAKPFPGLSEVLNDRGEMN